MSRREGLRELEATIDPILLQKWKQIFYFYDMNNDGLWTTEDMEIITNKVIDNSEMSVEKRKQATVVINDMWIDGLGGDLKGILTLRKWLTNLRRLFESGQMEKIVTVSRTRIFCCMDLDDNGSIDLAKFKIFHAAVGKSELPYMERAFRAMDTNMDGVISQDEYVKANIRYFCDTTIRLDQLPIFGFPTKFVNNTEVLK